MSGCRQPNSNVMSPPLIPETNIGKLLVFPGKGPLSLMTIPIAGPAVTVTGCVELFCSTPGTLCSGFRVLQED